MADIKENLANVRKNIEESCKKVGRDHCIQDQASF